MWSIFEGSIWRRGRNSREVAGTRWEKSHAEAQRNGEAIKQITEGDKESKEEGNHESKESDESRRGAADERGWAKARRIERFRMQFMRRPANGAEENEFIGACSLTRHKWRA